MCIETVLVESILQLPVFSWVKHVSQGYENLYSIKEMIQDKTEIQPGIHKFPSVKERERCWVYILTNSHKEIA